MLRNLIQHARLFKNPILQVAAFNRTLFTESALGIDVFRNEVDFYGVTTKDKNQIVNVFQEAVETKQLMVSQAVNMLYAVRTDEELCLFIKGMQKCHLEPVADEPFNFDVGIMKLLYTLNKTDLALELLMGTSAWNLLTPDACLVISTKLYKEGRYTDVIKLIDHLFQKKVHKASLTAPDITFTQDLACIAFASLYRIGDINAFNKLNQYTVRLKVTNIRIPIKAISLAVLLGLKNNDVNFGNHLLCLLRTLDGTIVVNLRLLLLSRLNLTEAVDILDKCRTDMKNGKKVRVHRSTINEMKEFIEKANNNADLLERFNKLVNELKSIRRINEVDFEKMFFLPLTRTFASSERSKESAQSNNMHQNGQFYGNNRGMVDQQEFQNSRYDDIQKFSSRNNNN